MGHKTAKSYHDLQQRLEKSIQGAPVSEALFKILEILFTEDEAKLVSKLPLKMFTIKRAAEIWKKPIKESEEILNELADKGFLVDLMNKGTRHFILAPTMAGFFEFSLMRTDGRFDRKVLSELYHQYINKEDAFVKGVFGIKPGIARTFVQEDTLHPKEKLIILDYEKATKVIENATCITVGTCYCRHKMEHVGKACDMPQNVCLSFNNCAKSLSKHGISKKINKKEAKKILDECISLGLVQIGDNIQDRVAWICNCCSCCCEAILAYKRLGPSMNMNSNFFSKVYDGCTGCGICVKKCPVDAIKIKDKKAKVDIERCIGCGVCARFCPTKNMDMKRRKETNFVPKDTFERFAITAINEGKLQNYIFDNYQLWTHELLRRLLGVILKLPPAKQILAQRQVQSRFLNVLTKSKRHIYPELKKK